MNIMGIIEAFILGVAGTLIGIYTGVLGFMLGEKNKKKSTSYVHFYVARDKHNGLALYLSKPFKDTNRFHACTVGCLVAKEDYFFRFGLCVRDYDNLKFEDGPIEVFLNLNV